MPGLGRQHPAPCVRYGEIMRVAGMLLLDRENRLTQS
jgi:hypothetical protein